MTERHRICKNCDYFVMRLRNRNVGCRKKIHTLIEYGSAQFANISKKDWCGKWSPKGYNNTPAIKASWDEFKTLHILAMTHV